ncbi:hypothetical protein [Serratia surfactantfaciens]|uniref:hypothetical protein n=1 Tax=Serratia surfactantfaciens TaxID=2741499 RepID=UPI003EE317C0
MTALRTPKAVILGLSAAIILIVIVRVFTLRPPSYINCKAETVTRKLLASGDALDLKVSGSLFIYDEDRAVIVQRGDITLRGKTYNLDQKLIFKLKKIGDGFYMTTQREVIKSLDDNAPDELTKEIPMISLGIKNGFFSMRKVRQDAYIMHGVLFPVAMCR